VITNEDNIMKLTSKHLAIRTRSVVDHDRIELKEVKSYKQRNNDKLSKSDNVVSVVNYLKRLIVK
jgi:hypothetical protein